MMMMVMRVEIDPYESPFVHVSSRFLDFFGFMATHHFSCISNPEYYRVKLAASCFAFLAALMTGMRLESGISAYLAMKG